MDKKQNNSKDQKQRLAELEYVLTDFVNDIDSANDASLAFANILVKIWEKESITPIDLARSFMFLRRIKIASTTINGLTSDMLFFLNGKAELQIGIHSLFEFVSHLEFYLGIEDLKIGYDYPEENLTLRIDGNKIIRVIVYLVKNASSIQEREDVTIRITFIPDEKLGMTITISDNGQFFPYNMLLHQSPSFKIHDK